MKPHQLIASLNMCPQGPTGLKGEEGLPGPAGTVVRIKTFPALAIAATSLLFRLLQSVKHRGCFHGDG